MPHYPKRACCLLNLTPPSSCPQAAVDSRAAFLFEWLCAEEALLLLLPASVTLPLDQPPRTVADAVLVEGAAAPTLARSAVLVDMQALPGVIGLEAVHAAFRVLTALFDSRVKTIPKSLLALFHAKADALEHKA